MPVIIFWSTAVFAQKNDCSYFLQGKVLDASTKEPIPYVTVKIKDEDKFTLTDSNGDFSINELCREQNTLIISCFGYCDTICEQNHQHGKIPHIYLTQEVLELSEVVISAEPNADVGTASVSQKNIKKEVLKRDPTQSLASALSGEEGVTMTSSGSNVQRPVIHGLYGNRVLILNNGLKHGFQNWGTDHAPEIDVSSAHSVTLVKGAAGVRYGPEALGGAIIVQGNPLYLNEPFFADIGTGYQTNGRGIFSNFELGQGLEKWSYYVGGNYTKIGDRFAPDYYLTNSGKEEKSANAGVRYHQDNWDLKVYYSFVDQNLALLRASIAESGYALANAINSAEPLIIGPFSYDINEPNQLTQHHLAKAEIDWLYSDKGMLTFRAGRQLNKRQEYDVRRNADKPIIDLDLISDDFQLEWKHPDWKRLDGLIGLQVFTQNNDNNPGTGTTPFIPNYNSQRYSAFITESLTKGKNNFEVGLRFDHENNNVRGRETNQDIFRDDFSFTNFTSSIGYILTISESSSFRTNVGTAWRIPNIAELYSYGQHGFKSSFGLLRYHTDQEGNLLTDRVIKMSESTVTPEKGYKWINEWSTQKKVDSYTITAYANYIQNFIYERPVAIIGTIRGPMPAFIFDRADALFLGADFSWQRKWTNHLSGTYTFSSLWSKNTERDEPLIYQPPISTAYNLVWEMPVFHNISSQLTFMPSYTFRQFRAPRTINPEDFIDGTADVNVDSEIFDFKDAPDGYFLLDMSWSFISGNFKGSIGVQNVFNKAYRNYLNQMRYFADEPGINFLFTINYMFNAKIKKG